MKNFFLIQLAGSFPVIPPKGSLRDEESRLCRDDEESDERRDVYEIPLRLRRIGMTECWIVLTMLCVTASGDPVTSLLY